MTNTVVGILTIIVTTVVSTGTGVFNEVTHRIALLKFTTPGKLKTTKTKIMVTWVTNNKMGWVVLKLKQCSAPTINFPVRQRDPNATYISVFCYVLGTETPVNHFGHSDPSVTPLLTSSPVLNAPLSRTYP